MRILRKVLRIGGWTLATGITLIIAVYLTALVINREDRPPSREAREMAALLDARPEVADGDNAYVYMLGFAAPRGADPWQIGRKRADWIRRLRTNHELGRDSDPYSVSMNEVWNPEEKAFFRLCPWTTRQSECFAMLNDAGPELEEWLAEQEWVLARYQTLLSYPSWRAIHTDDHRVPSPTISNLIGARNAWFLEAWSRANRGDIAGVREALRNDLEFWRLVLSESHSLVSKMVAARFVNSHFERSNLILRRLPADRPSGAVPASWREPISADERSLYRAFAFELRYARSHLERRWAGEGRHATWKGVKRESPGVLQRLGHRAMAALFQPQDLLNKRAHSFSLFAEALVEPYERIPDALDRARLGVARDAGSGGWSEALYNFTGDILRKAGTVSYGYYATQISDVEGVRRAALLVAELRSRGVPPSGIEAAIANAQLRNPYTGEPFTWDADSGAIVFDGITRPPRGRHVFWY